MLHFAQDDLSTFLPDSLRALRDPKADIPRIAKTPALVNEIYNACQSVPTYHRLYRGDARDLSFIPDATIHLILTSPPYWTLKKYRDHELQLGDIQSYDVFLDALDKVWKECHRVLVPGGRLICVVGDVCLSRRRNKGRHTVVPLHASIQERCRAIGFDNLAPIIWYKIANATYEATGNGAGFLGKPYEPNCVIKNDIEYILMQRKPGGYRKPTLSKRLLSIISHEDHKTWFRAIWSDIAGASTRNHPAPFPEPLAERLIRMFSFAGDVVLDPFVGTGTTMVGAAKWGRHSIGIEVDPAYHRLAADRLSRLTDHFFSHCRVDVLS